MQMRTVELGERLVEDFGGRQLSSIENEVAHLVAVDALSQRWVVGDPEQSEVLGVEAHARRASGQLSVLIPADSSGAEAPSCGICLEQIGWEGEGGDAQCVTSICNHMFHPTCLLRWEGAPCPICRYDPVEVASQCETCGAISDVWVCLICGFAGCGRYGSDHARAHFCETLHTYALDTQTQQVWDFAGDGYVHRLLYDKAGHKVVEGAAPSDERAAAPTHLSDSQREEAEHAKLEGLAVEYNAVLQAQLELQRKEFEEQLARLRREDTVKREGDLGPAGLMRSLARQKKRIDARCTAAEERLVRSEEENRFLQDLNRSSMQNQEAWQRELGLAEEEVERLQKAVSGLPVLEENVRELMRRLDDDLSFQAGGADPSSPAGPAERPARPSGFHGEGAQEAKGDAEDPPAQGLDGQGALGAGAQVLRSQILAVLQGLTTAARELDMVSGDGDVS